MWSLRFQVAKVLQQVPAPLFELRGYARQVHEKRGSLLIGRFDDVGFMNADRGKLLSRVKRPSELP
jgi:hypothetical protein